MTKREQAGQARATRTGTAATRRRLIAAIRVMRRTDLIAASGAFMCGVILNHKLA
jgi:hypothetical protein